MDWTRFDELTVAAATGSRRALWRSLAGLTAGGALALGARPATTGAAQKNCKGSYSQSKVKRYIRKAARKHGVSYRQMLCVAQCESGLDPCAKNKSGPYYGLFQFLESTFDKTKYGGKNIYSPKWNALAAAWLWKRTPKKDLGNVWTCYKIAKCG